MKRELVSHTATISAVLGAIASLAGLGLYLQKSLHVSELALASVAVILGGLAGIFSKYIADLVQKLRVAPRVFLSYSYANRAVAEKLSETLRARGARVWLDLERMKPGDEIWPTIEKAIEDTDTFIALLSGNLSANLAFELSIARAKGLKVIPVLLEDVQIPSDLKGLRYIDLRGDYSHGLDELVRAVT
jgi:hypothetical protein